MHPWIFGYGSLIFRPDFPYRSREPGAVSGFARRFYQGSPDHRGVPGAPGRVVTLLEEAASECWGVVYELDPEVFRAVIDALDQREVAGYEQRRVDVRLARGERVRALTYIATPENPNYLGALSEAEIAAHVRTAEGKSGTNADYVRELARALRGMEAVDPHVFEIERWLD